jgi:ATP adenylyltransferase/5',5'''-P-1,P-4-tetraphosphate phosphorylase II
MIMSEPIGIDLFIERQLIEWEQAGENYAGLQKVMVRTIPFSGYEMLVQFNPKRIISSSARIDAKSISERPCFLCDHNRPFQQQGLPYENDYIILVNPYPVFRKHLTIPSVRHLPQSISGNFKVMLKLASDLPQFTIIYNGPKCGASAPDHFHFQAVERGVLPIESDFSSKRKVRPEGNLQGVTV